MKRFLLVSGAVYASSLALCSSGALGAGYHVYICGTWSNNAGPLVPAYVPGTLAEAVNCGISGNASALDLSRQGLQAVPNGQGASWTATAPPGITVTQIYTVNDEAWGVGSGDGWWGEFFWNGGPGPAGRSSQVTSAITTYGCCQASFNAQTIGWFMSCAWSSCTRDAGINIGGVDLAADENTGPWLTAPSGLWQTSGWIRTQYQLAFYGDSPSGVCGLSASLNGQAVTLGPGAAVARNTGTFHQCAGASANATVQTADYGQGPMPLTINGCDAAGVCTGGTYTKTIYVDNSHPWVSLASPGDVADTGQTQYVTATAGGSLSGIAEIDCRVDGGAVQRFAEGGAQQPSQAVPVSGLGVHAIQCGADNTAVAQDGSHGWSTSPATTTLKIGEPTVSAISFTSIANRLRCRRVRKRVRVPAHWVTVRRHHRLTRVHRRAGTKVVKVTRCHPRMVKRRITVWVTVHRHGKKVRVKRRKVVRVAVPPTLVAHPTKRVRHGRGTTVSGWLGTTGSIALPGQTIRVLTAPDNGLGQFSLAAIATTDAYGGWTAELPAGPSRLVEAVYDGGPTTEPAVSGQVRLIVPAKVTIRIAPRIVPWGAKIRITGQVLGGYVPGNSNLLRLNVGIGRIGHLEGLPEIRPDGRFVIVWRFDPGRGVLHPWFSVGTLSESGFPWAPSTSKRTVVTLGKPTPITRHHHRRHKNRKRHTRR